MDNRKDLSKSAEDIILEEERVREEKEKRALEEEAKSLQSDKTPLVRESRYSRPPMARWKSRMTLKHVTDTRPVWHILRLFLGAATVLAVNKAAYCRGNEIFCFVFKLCVQQMI